MTMQREALIRQLSNILLAAPATRDEALREATTFIDAAMKLGREPVVSEQVAEVARTVDESTKTDAEIARLADYLLRHHARECTGPGDGVSVVDVALNVLSRMDIMTRDLAEKYDKDVSRLLTVGAPSAGPVGEPYQAAGGQWFMRLLLSFTDEQEAHDFSSRWNARHGAFEPATSRCEIQPAVEPSPILRIETTRGAVSVDVRTIVGAAWTDGGTVYLAAPDHRALDFPGADQAALALDRIHAARTLYDDQHAEDRRTERMAEAIARGVSEELRAVLPGLGARLVSAVEQRVLAAGLRSDLSAADAVRHLAAVRDRQQSLLARVLGWREMRDDDWRALLLEIDAVLEG